MVAHCGTVTCTSGNSLSTVDSDGNVGFASALAIGSDGLPVIAYRDGTDATVVVAHCGNIDCTAGNTLNTLDGGQRFGLYIALAIGSDGLPFVSYDDGTFGEQALRTAHCGDLSCSSGNTITIHGVIGEGGFGSSIAIGTDGYPIISYRAGNSYPRVLHCGNVLCSGGDTITQIGPDQSLSTRTSIAIGTDGLPIFAYYARNLGIKLVHCGNVECSSGNTINVVDEGVAVASWPSVTLGSDGLPVISYQRGNDTLMVALCGDNECASGNVLTTIDVAGPAEYSSIALGLDGLPVISYYGNIRLKVAHCGDVACGAFKPTPTPTATNTPTGHDPAVTSLTYPTWPAIPRGSSATRKVTGTIQNLGTVKDSYTVRLVLDAGLDLFGVLVAEPGDSALFTCSTCSTLEFSVTDLQPGATFEVSRDARFRCPQLGPGGAQFFSSTLSADDVHGMDSNPSDSSLETGGFVRCVERLTPTPKPEPVGGIGMPAYPDRNVLAAEDGPAMSGVWLIAAIGAAAALLASGAIVWVRRRP